MYHTLSILTKSLSVSIIMLACLPEGRSQQPSLSSYYLDTAHIIIIASGDAAFNATDLTNAFARTFVDNSFISTDVKDKALEKTGRFNRLGGDLNSGFGLSFRIDSIFEKHPYHLQFFTGFYDRQHLDARYGHDLFELAFYGNKPFAGDTAAMDGAEFNYFRYQQFELGISSDNGMGRRLSAGLSMLKGEKLLEVNTGNSYLYTSDIGDRLELYANASVRQSDTSTANTDAFNGWGLSANLMYELNYNTLGNSPGSGYLRIECSDLGFIRWNENTFNYSMDTTFRYSGIYIQDIFNLQDSVFNETVDSMQEAFNSQRAKSANTFILPPLFRLTLGQVNGKRHFTAGIHYRHKANATPFIYLQEGYKPTDFLLLSARLAYGGYGRISGGLEAVILLAGFEITAGTSNLDGLIFTNSRSGFSAYAAMRKKF